MERIKTELNISSYEIVSQKDKLGDFSDDREWEGVIQDVVKGQADIGLAGITMTAKRVESVEFSTPLLHFGFAVVRKSPDQELQLQRSVFFCFSPFSSGVWACFFIVLFVTVGLLTANAARNPRERAQRMGRGELGPTNSEEPVTIRDHLSHAFWFVVSSTALQSGARQPMSVAGRLLALTWWLFAGLTLCTFIIALLMDLISSSGYQAPPFVNMKELMDSWVSNKGYHVYFQHDTVREKFRKNTRPMFQFLYAHSTLAEKDATKGEKGSPAWVKAMLKDSRNLIVMGSESTRQLMENMDCGSILATEFLDDRYVGLVFPRNKKALRAAVNQVLVKMAENGEARQLVHKYGLRGRGKCGLGFDQTDPMRSIRQVLLTETVTEAVRGVAEMFHDSLPISMPTFAGILVLYIVGLIFSLCGLALDIYIYTHPEGFKVRVWNGSIF